MKVIGVDAGCLSVCNKHPKTGVYYFFNGLLRALSKLSSDDRFILYSFNPLNINYKKSFGANFVNKVVLPKKFWINLAMSYELIRNTPDVFLGFGQAAPIVSLSKKIIFVYDLAFEFFPNCYKNHKRLSKQTIHACKVADVIVAISKSTKKDLVNYYGIDKKRIEVVYPGCDPLFSPRNSESIDKIKKKYKINSKYLLFVGTFKPLKNITNIINAFLSLKYENNYKLILVGSSTSLTDKLKVLINDNNSVFGLGYVSRTDMPALYSGAELFISPSLYEGFGIPLLEAMSCGTPVITSNCSSMPEVVGNAGIVVNPNSISEITSAIHRILNNKKLKNSLHKKSLIQSKKFSYETSAEKLYKIVNLL